MAEDPNLQAIGLSYMGEFHAEIGDFPYGDDHVLAGSGRATAL
jgi:hypothetical protein